MTNLTANASTNYSEEMIASIKAAYTANPTRETVDALSKETGKPVRSLISKLSALGIYVKATPVAKTSEPIIKKEVFVAELQSKIGIELPSFEKMTKADIQSLIAHLA
jgi:dTDP-4-amino-4,6-dideoxygalactose transaminase